MLKLILILFNQHSKKRIKSIVSTLTLLNFLQLRDFSTMIRNKLFRKFKRFFRPLATLNIVNKRFRISFIKNSNPASDCDGGRWRLVTNRLLQRDQLVAARIKIFVRTSLEACDGEKLVFNSHRPMLRPPFNHARPRISYVIVRPDAVQISHVVSAAHNCSSFEHRASSVVPCSFQLSNSMPRTVF